MTNSVIASVMLIIYLVKEYVIALTQYEIISVTEDVTTKTRDPIINDDTHRTKKSTPTNNGRSGNQNFRSYI